MALPDLQAVKDRLRIENDVEDDDLELMMASALATIIEAAGRPLEATERTFVIDAAQRNWDGFRPCSTFLLPLYPVAHEGSDLVTILDADEADFTDFRVNTVIGRISATGGAVFDNFPYTVTAKVGLELMANYATRVEPKLAQAFLDLIADWYQRRNPGALSEGAGGGGVTQWQTLGVPERICKQLEPYRLARAL